MNFSITSNIPYTRREELSDTISDSWKDLYGCRPRHIDYRNTPIEELEEIADRLSEDLHEECVREEKEHEEAVKLCMECGAPDVETAERWLDEAEYGEFYSPFDDSMEYHESIEC